MKINIKKLQTAVNLNPTKRSQTESIKGLCDQIDNGSITIPMYQRGLTWNEKKEISLFNYQLFGKAPVSPLSFNKIGNHNDVPQLSFVSRKTIKNKDDSKGNLSVVDGQQRLTTNYRAYCNDPSFDHFVLDVTQAKFKRVSKVRHNQIPIGILLDKKGQQILTKYLQQKYNTKEYTDLIGLLLGIRNKMLSYMYTLHIADDMTEKEQIEWFKVLNNAGSRISGIDLALSEIHSKDFDIHKEFIKPYQSEVEKYDFKNLFLPFSTKVSYPIASLNPAYEIYIEKGKHSKNYAPIPSDTKENKLVKLNMYQLNQIKDLTLKALHQALEFIKQNELKEYISRMIYIMYLTGYFVFHPSENYSHQNDLIRWIKTINFKNTSNGQRRDIFEKLIKNNFD